MRFYTQNEELQACREVIGAVSGSDAVVKVVNGAGKTGSGLCSLITLIDQNRTLNLRIHTSVPEGFSGDKETVTVKASQYTGVLDALLAYKADVGAGLDDKGRFSLDVKGKARVEVGTLAESPAEVRVSKPIYAFSLGAAENSKLLKRGLSCAADSACIVQGAQNGVLIINTANAEIVAFSMDGSMFSRAEIKGKLPKIPSGDSERGQKLRAVMTAQEEALKAFLEKSGQSADRLTVAIPREEIMRLRSLTQGAKLVQYQLDDTHVSVCVDSSVVYTFTQGAAIPADVDVLMEKLRQMPGEKVVVDCDALMRGIDLHNKVLSLAKKNGKSSVRLEVKDDITCSSGSGGRTVSTVPVSAKTGECEFYVTGQLFKTALGLMPKGSLVLDVKSQIVLFKSGSSEVIDETAAVGLMQVIHSVGKEELKPDDGQAEEG